MEVIVISLISRFNVENGGLVNGTDYTISTSNTNGSPVITYIDINPQGILYNLDRLFVSEAYRRFLSVIYDLCLSGNTGWNISSNSVLIYVSIIIVLIKHISIPMEIYI